MKSDAKRDPAKDDEAVLTALREGPMRLMHLVARTHLEERVVDRTLQRLRKRGAVRFHRPNTTWWLNEATKESA